MKNRPLLVSFGSGLLAAAGAALSLLTVLPTVPYHPVIAITAIGIGLVVSALIYEIVR